MFLRINSDHFPKEHGPTDYCNEDVLCFLSGRNWTFKYLDELRAQRVKNINNSFIKILSMGQLAYCYLWWQEIKNYGGTADSGAVVTFLSICSNYEHLGILPKDCICGFNISFGVSNDYSAKHRYLTNSCKRVTMRFVGNRCQDFMQVSPVKWGVHGMAFLNILWLMVIKFMVIG
jgi:hypothetical protein